MCPLPANMPSNPLASPRRRRSTGRRVNRSAYRSRSNGLDWVRVGTIDDGEPSAGMTLPDGTIFIDSDFPDGDHPTEAISWRRERTPQDCYHGSSPIFLASAGTADLPLYGGESNVCLAADRPQGLGCHELPTEGDTGALDSGVGRNSLRHPRSRHSRLLRTRVLRRSSISRASTARPGRRYRGRLTTWSKPPS